MCPYVVCLVADVDRRLWLREALSPYVILRKGDGGRGGRGPGLRMYNRAESRPLFYAARAFRTKLSTAKLRVAEGAVGDEKVEHRIAGCATPRGPAPLPKREKLLERGVGGPEEELTLSKSTGHWMRNRRSRERSKSRASLIERRRLGPGKASSRHGGGVEAVLASLDESVSACTAKRHAPVSTRIATEASEARLASCVGSQEPGCKTPPQCEVNPLKRPGAS